MMKMADADGKMVYKGYCVDLLDALSELMNFDYEIYESTEGYGMMAPDRSWNGVIKELIDHVSYHKVASSRLSRLVAYPRTGHVLGILICGYSLLYKRDLWASKSAGAHSTKSLKISGCKR